MLRANILRSLGNSAAAYHAWNNAIHQETSLGLGTGEAPDFFSALHGIENIRREGGDGREYIGRRHPDPENLLKIEVTSSDLQVRGSWKKLAIGSGGGLAFRHRAACTSLIWRSTLYIFGGFDPEKREPLNDAWALSLSNFAAGWRAVNVPESIQSLCNAHGVLYESAIYFFFGEPTLYVSDLQHETWQTVSTAVKDGSTWAEFYQPADRTLRVAARSESVALVQGSMYVFGGTSPNNDIGRNALFQLDIASRTWHRLAGGMDFNGDISVPGCRVYSEIWGVGSKLYVGLGAAKTNKLPRQHNAYYMGTENVYGDLWSYNNNSRRWRKEKILGNPPCPRTLQAYVFNPKWGRAVVYGGYNFLPFQKPGVDVAGIFSAIPNFPFSANSLGDAFLWDAETGRWSHIIARGFPSYRVASSMIVDPESGRTFLFGGATSPNHTPTSKNVLFRGFKDLWELCVDLPGTGFQQSDFEVDPRFAALGPWRSCFTCGSVGKWMVCAGTCRSTDRSAAFCGTDCQKLGWREHKRLNGCRNTKTIQLGHAEGRRPS